jgi:hypothetical protein
MIDYCRPNVLRAIEELEPEVIIPLGRSAIRSVVGWAWNGGVGDIGEVGRWVGWQIPSQKLNAWICPTYHPSFLLRSKSPVLDLYFDKHIGEAVALEGRPWRKVPDYKSQVRVIYNLDEAAEVLDRYLAVPGTMAFDFETSTLKPDNKEVRIVCCSVCWEGKETVAFPWFGKAIRRTRKLLVSREHKKIGWNAKFEHRWVRAKLDVEVNGWVWDGMVAAHVLDNRPETTRLKFQAFVTLGQSTYNDHIDEFLRPGKNGGGGNDTNRINHVDLKDLLLYCGLDSLLEYKVGTLQMEAMGYGRYTEKVRAAE